MGGKKLEAAIARVVLPQKSTFPEFLEFLDVNERIQSVANFVKFFINFILSHNKESNRTGRGREHTLSHIILNTYIFNINYCITRK